MVPCVAVALPAGAGASTIPVPRDYYGVNYAQIATHDPPTRDRQLAEIAHLGITQVRALIAWYAVEPNAPVGTQHTYDFQFSDQLIGAAASHGIHLQVIFGFTPSWASGNNVVDSTLCNTVNAPSQRPDGVSDYALAAAAMVQRYGDGGSFWAENPDLPYRPVTTWEIWNEPSNPGYWCPTPNPGMYADMFALAARDMKAVDPNARTVVAGLPLTSASQRPPKYYSPEQFLQRALAHNPGFLRRADAVAVHAYPHGGIDQQLGVISQLRGQLHAGGVPNSVPMLVNEIGWSLQGSSISVSEQARARRYARVTTELPRTNCNISGMVAHTWTSLQSDPNNADQWYGIANPQTAQPYPSARAYAHAIALMRGKLSRHPPRQRIRACAGGGTSGVKPACTITGTNGSDVLRGTPERDVLCGLRGNDVIKGRGGADVIRGAAGRDKIYGQRGRDRLLGGGGPDLLEGGPGRDVLRGGPGRDRSVQ
jgi:hypothetical protein